MNVVLVAMILLLSLLAWKTYMIHFLPETWQLLFTLYLEPRGHSARFRALVKDIYLVILLYIARPLSHAVHPR